MKQMISEHPKEVDKNNNKEGMGAAMTVLGLVNGMLGGTCLVLPLAGLKTGYITTVIVCLCSGFICYYTAYLIVMHLGKGKNIRHCILTHFQQDYRYMVGYSFIMWFGLVTTILIYFRTICLQVEGLLGYHASWIGPGVALILTVAVVIIRILHVGEETIAYGIISIVAYLLFLVWAQCTAPSGQKHVATVGQPITLTSTLVMAFSIHDIVVQNIIKNPDKQNYQTIVNATFITGSIAYLFMALGSFAIVNRHSYKASPEIINDYFKAGQWQNVLIEVVYLVHMASAYPNFLIISKVRFFQIFKVQIKHNIGWHQVIYIAAVVLVSFLIYISNIHLDIMITLKGAIIGMMYIIIIPIWIHFRCLFVNRSCGFIRGDDENNRQIVLNQCECQGTYRSKWTLYLQTFFLVFVLILGFSLMGLTIWKVAKGQ